MVKEMKKVAEPERTPLLLIFISLLSSGFVAHAVPYDYTASIECLETPQKAQYNGGGIVNPELNDGLAGWSTFGNAKLEHRESPSGNGFILAQTRAQPFDSVSQKVELKTNLLYTFSAWLQVSQGNPSVAAVFKTSSGYVEAGTVIAKPGCWSMLKGGLTVETSGEASLFFQTQNSTADVMVDSISLQPFTPEEWKSHQDQTMDKVRKAKVRIQVVDKLGNSLPKATVSVQQNALTFPLGCAINKNILTNAAYEKWFASRAFRVTTFEDEMKWYSTEPTRGHEDYSAADALLEFAKQHKLAVRGHNVLWDDPTYQQGWLNSLSPQELSVAVDNRIHSVMSKYKGQVIAWDVMNENLHFSYFETKLGPNASGHAYNLASRTDGTIPLFMNEYNTIEEVTDPMSTPAKYLQKLREIQAYSGNADIKMAIGLESHFVTPNIPYMRASIDILAAAGLPIWLTEVDVKQGPKQAIYLEEVLREGFSHPEVEGIVVWGAWNPKGCYRMCLTDNNFNNLATGDVVDRLLQEWGGSKEPLVLGETDENGFLEASLFHGDYNVTIAHPGVNSLALPQRMIVASVAPTQAQPSVVKVTV
ncbi:unnamed protein product [Linum trigynum]|uniref:GH10 domain-containing protein n=1 Tax=Linum trigynum TaxID=586398 RepID=A0AAV2E0S1_9ROSI